MLEIELGSLCMIGKHSTHWITPQDWMYLHPVLKKIKHKRKSNSSSLCFLHFSCVSHCPTFPKSSLQQVSLAPSILFKLLDGSLVHAETWLEWEEHSIQVTTSKRLHAFKARCFHYRIHSLRWCVVRDVYYKQVGGTEMEKVIITNTSTALLLLSVLSSGSEAWLDLSKCPCYFVSGMYVCQPWVWRIDNYYLISVLCQRSKKPLRS